MASRPELKLKKRHVKSLTRLPTKRMATACWAFIVVKTTWLQTAPMLDFSSLQPANSKNHQQFIHRRLWMGWGLLRVPTFIAQTGEKRDGTEQIVPFRRRNPGHG
jgi:hypothetical protein